MSPRSFVGWVRGSFLDWQASFYEESVGVAAGKPLFTIATSCISIGGILGSMAGAHHITLLPCSRRACW